MDKETVKFVDANIFLEVFLKDNRWEEARDFLNKLSKEEFKGVTSDFIVFSILLQIQDKAKSTDLMKDFITALGNIEGLKVAHFTYGILLKAMVLMEKYGLDFDDSLQVGFMESMGIKEIISFDKDFDRIPGIKRVEPRETLH